MIAAIATALAVAHVAHAAVKDKGKRSSKQAIKALRDVEKLYNDAAAKAEERNEERHRALAADDQDTLEHTIETKTMAKSKTKTTRRGLLKTFAGRKKTKNKDKLERKIEKRVEHSSFEQLINYFHD